MPDKKVFLVLFILTIVLFIPGRLLAQDFDLDGMPDSYELLHPCLMPEVPDADLDPDLDGHTNTEEYEVIDHTDPCDPDSDDDGLLDGAEFLHYTDPWDPDTDSDSISDFYEAMHPCLDPLSFDSDTDFDLDSHSSLTEYIGNTDSCTFEEFFFDEDLDGLSDEDEFTIGTDSSMIDTDLDNLPDGAELGVVVAAGPNGIVNSTPGGDDLAFFGYITPGPNGIPETSALFDDLQLIPLTYAPGIFQLTDPLIADCDGDGSLDGTELAGGGNPWLDLIVSSPAIISPPRVVGFKDDMMHGYELSHMRLAWSGSEYFVSDGSVIRKYDGEGRPLLGRYGEPYYPLNAMFWTGSELAVFESDKMTRLNASLEVIAQIPLQVGRSVIWTGSEFAEIAAGVTLQVKWYSPTGELLRTTDTGVNMTGQDYSFGFSGSQIALFIKDSNNHQAPTEVKFVSISGVVTDGPTIPGRVYVITWTGANYLLLKGVNENEVFYLEPMDSDGNLIGPPVQTDYYYGVRYIPFPDHSMVMGLGGIFLQTLTPMGVMTDLIWNTPRCDYGGTRWTGEKLDVFCWAESGYGLDEFELKFFSISIGDRDGDGIQDPDELDVGTNPADWDSDDDGMGDGYENGHDCLWPLVPDAGADADGDGLSNLHEFLGQTDACSADTDSDGLKDGDEVAAGGAIANPDTDGDGLSDGWETGVVVGPGPNGVLDSTVAAGDSLVGGYIRLGTNLRPDSNAAGDDVQAIPVSVPALRLFITNPAAADTDGDGVKDKFEIDNGGNPIAATVKPALVNTINTLIAQDYSWLAWTGSDYVALYEERYHDAQCPWDDYSCRSNLFYQRLDRRGRPTTAAVSVTTGINSGPKADLVAGQVWIDATIPAGTPRFIRVDRDGSVSTLSIRVNFSGAGWNGSQVMGGVANDLDASVSFPRYDADAELLGSSTLTWAYVWRTPFPGVWTGSEYGFPLPDGDVNFHMAFARISADGTVVSRTSVTDLYTFSADPVWTGSEYVLSFNTNWDPVNNIAAVPFGGMDASVLLRLDGQGRPLGQTVIPTAGVTRQGHFASFTRLAWDGHYLGQVTPEPSGEGTIQCGDDDCPISRLLRWHTAAGEEIGDPVSLGEVSAVPAGHDRFVYSLLSPYEGGSTFMAWSSDSDGDGVPDAAEAGGCVSAFNYDSDFDGTADGAEDPDGDGLIGAADPASCAADADDDGLTDPAEVAAGTDPLAADSDADGLPDPFEAGASCLDPGLDDADADPDADGYSNLVEFNQSTDPCVFTIIDSDGDGLSNDDEIAIGTDPYDADSDDDGIPDGTEHNSLATNPLDWDSDGDLLPDGFEQANLAGHAEGQNLNPLSYFDGAADFDGDGIVNADDYWNGGGSMNGGSGGAVSGGGAWVADKIGFAACGYWGEGDGDGFISPSDLAVISLAVKGSPDYAAVYPTTGETQDMDADTFLSPTDRGLLSQMIKGQEIVSLGSRPAVVSRVVPATGVNLSGAVGEAVTVTVAVTNTATAAAPGIPVVFSIAASSSGSATIVGGEGADAANTRYDLTTARADGGRASATLVLTAAGTVTVEAKVKQCGADGIGRYCAEVLLAEPVTIIVTP